MPYFRGDFSGEQLQILRAAAAECYDILDAAGDEDKKRTVAEAILAAAQRGIYDHAQLVALGLAAGRRREPTEESP